MSQSSKPARQIGFNPAPERRRQPRMHLPVCARVSRTISENDSRLAYMRDANIRGAFFFCDLQVAIGETLYVHLAAAEAKTGLNVDCEASVVRVEKSPNALTGVAVEFHRFEVEDPAHAHEDVSSSWIHWTAARFDQMFARRLELEKCAFRIQGAA